MFHQPPRSEHSPLRSEDNGPFRAWKTGFDLWVIDIWITGVHTTPSSPGQLSAMTNAFVISCMRLALVEMHALDVSLDNYWGQ